jgi:hypothetical protein
MTRFAAAVLVALALPAPARAQDAGGQISGVVKIGERVTIVDDVGRKAEGRVESSSDEAIRLSMRGRTEDIPVARIIRIDKPDSVKNGALIGLGLGLGSGIIGSVATGQGSSRGGVLVASMISNTMVWTALGTAVDAMIDNRRTLYIRGAKARILPIVRRDVRGGVIALTW